MAGTTTPEIKLAIEEAFLYIHLPRHRIFFVIL